MRLIDTHIHLTNPSYQANIENVILGAKTAKVEHLITLASTLNDSYQNQKIANQFTDVYFGAGVHPHDADSFSEKNLAELTEIIKDKKCVAVGEIGLDFYYEHSTREQQELVFRLMLRLAKEFNKPISLHTRNAEKEVLQVMLEENYFMGVCHSYTGEQEFIEKFLEKGMFFSVNGMLTFKKNQNVVEILKNIPLNRLLLETDGPYLAPVPHRGKTNQPEYLVYVLQKVAEVLAVDEEDLAEALYNNARNLFGINV